MYDERSGDEVVLALLHLRDEDSHRARAVTLLRTKNPPTNPRTTANRAQPSNKRRSRSPSREKAMTNVATPTAAANHPKPVAQI